MAKPKKLELTWIGKDEQPRLEPRILIEDPEKSYSALKHQTTPNPSLTKEGSFGKTHSLNSSPPILGGDKGVVNNYTGNMLIHGDNLLALKALEQDFSGKIKCIYIDPPFNTGSAFEHYDDGLEHSIWLNLMRDRLQILQKLLRNDGSIYVHIDNNEQAYLKVLLDEIFKRSNFVQMISVKRASPAGFKVINPGPLTVTDYIFLYAKDRNYFDYKPLRIPVPYDDNYNLYITNPQDKPERWQLARLTDLLYKKYSFKDWKDAKKAWGSNWKVIRDSFLGDLALELKDYVVSVRDPHKPSQTIKGMMDKSKENPNKVFVIEREDYNPIFIYNGGSLSFYKEKLREIDGVLTPTELLTDFWDDINFAGIANEGGVQFKNSKKPEMLVRRVLQLSTNPGDLVLDSFLGSGTTAAVAHKMNRRWIGIELGEHCHTHCLPRLKKVVDGTDQGGISKAVNWQGGGGFKYYYLAPSLLKEDKYGNWIIDERYKADMLAAAMAKHEGFRYSPDEQIYWKQGKSTEKDYIFTTTKFVTVEFLDKMHDEMQPDESLLICCKSFSKACESRYLNITVKKIPKMLLGRCEFGKEDYSLNIVSMSVEADTTEPEPHSEIKIALKKPKRSAQKLPLLGGDDES